MTPIDHTNAVRELAYRENHGIAVTLLWGRLSNDVTVVVEDRESSEAFRIPTPASAALAVFNHPYAHARAA